MNEATINEMRAKVHAFDEATLRKIELECEIASLETDVERYYMREIKEMMATVDGNNGYPHLILSRKVLNIGEVAAALLPVLRAKLADVQKQLEAP